MPEEYLRDFVWMCPPDGGSAEQVLAEPLLLTQKMVAGWKQCDPPAAEILEEVK